MLRSTWLAPSWCLVVCAIAACTPASYASTAGLSKDDAVLEAVFLHELANDKSRDDEVVCLAVRGQTSDGSALLAAIQARHPTAVRNIECSGGGPSGPVTSHGRPAVRFDIGPVEWRDDGTARVKGGGAHRGGMVVDEREYTVVKTGNGWKITDQKPGLQI